MKPVTGHSQIFHNSVTKIGTSSQFPNLSDISNKLTIITSITKKCKEEPSEMVSRNRLFFETKYFSTSLLFI